MKKITRRETLAFGAYTGVALLATGRAAKAVDAPIDGGAFSVESTEASTSEQTGFVRMVPHAHEGKGTLRVRKFGFANAQRPAGFLIYDIPPGASEGVHLHGFGLSTGAYDEYYYVVSGMGQMEIDGKIVPVGPGDYVHTPLGVKHGIENIHQSDNLRVHLTFINRA